MLINYYFKFIVYRTTLGGSSFRIICINEITELNYEKKHHALYTPTSRKCKFPTRISVKYSKNKNCECYVTFKSYVPQIYAKFLS